MATIRQGDKCWVLTANGKKHYGVCTGYDDHGIPWFVHNTRDGGVVHTTRKAFSGRRPINIEQHAPEAAEALVAGRALALVGREYSLFNFNCEHTANLAAYGRAESRQVENGVALAGLGTLALTALLAVINENGTSVGGDGYRRDAAGQFGSRRWW
jgi:hypothetical protein